jgi:hypothetical protein
MTRPPLDPARSTVSSSGTSGSALGGSGPFQLGHPWGEATRRFSDLTVSRKWLLPLLLAGFLSLAPACGGGGQSPTLGGTTPDTSPSPSVASSSPTSTPTEPRYPNLGKFTDPIDRFSYKSAYGDCRILGLEGTAESYGGDPADPASVARAFANAVYSQATSYRAAAFQGCLDAFDQER